MMMRSRRMVLQGLIASSVVIGFDLVDREWVTSANATSKFTQLPRLDGILYIDDATRTAVADDFGHIIRRQPLAVLKPGSIEDIVRLIRFARQFKIRVAARGQGHSCYGQSQVEAGVVMDLSTLNRIYAINSDRVEVDAGVLWSQLLRATLPQGLTPPVLTDYLELSIGGTLSVGGIGGASHRYGVQIDNVFSLQVVTGEGKLETCSPYQNRELFQAVLAGLGQCGIIVRATIRLIPAATEARVFQLFYDKLTDFTADQTLLISDRRFQYVEGQIVPRDGGGWRYLLEVASFYTPTTLPKNNLLLAGLRYIKGQEKIEEKSYFDFLNRLAPTVEFLKSIGAWSYPHPWINLFIPSTGVVSYINQLVATLTPADTGQSPVLLYPVNTDRFNLPLFRVPREPIAFLLAILRTAVPPDEATVRRLVTDNRRLFESNRALGGYQYPVGAIPFSRSDWRQHFQPLWGKFVTAKRRFDPNQILTPSQGIF
jgi:cytokinin dehydrogenase